jgi:type II secretory pathway component PulL
MRPWAPQSLYEARPWVLIAAGGLLGIGATLWSLVVGYWTVWRGLSLFAGAALAIVGGIILQLRQDYRARSKLRRVSTR